MANFRIVRNKKNVKTKLPTYIKNIKEVPHVGNNGYAEVRSTKAKNEEKCNGKGSELIQP